MLLLSSFKTFGVFTYICVLMIMILRLLLFYTTSLKDYVHDMVQELSIKILLVLTSFIENML